MKRRAVATQADFDLSGPQETCRVCGRAAALITVQIGVAAFHYCGIACQQTELIHDTGFFSLQVSGVPSDFVRHHDDQ